MRRHLCSCVLALACLAAVDLTSRADIRITISTTPAVRPAGVVVYTPGYYQPAVPPPPAPVYVPPPPVPPTQVQALTHYEFAKAFHPAPGKYKVELLHPGTCCPVCVEFCLPCGCPKVRVHHRSLVFNYGKEEVVVRFQIGGKVKVSYD